MSLKGVMKMDGDESLRKGRGGSFLRIKKAGWSFAVSRYLEHKRVRTWGSDKIQPCLREWGWKNARS